MQRTRPGNCVQPDSWARPGADEKGTTMLTAEAIVQTDHPDRYIARLCKHASKMSGRLVHRPRATAAAMHPRDTARRMVRQPAESSP